MPSPEWRSFESGDRIIRVRTLENGSFLVNVVSSGVTIAITVPAEQVEHLFGIAA